MSRAWRGGSTTRWRRTRDYVLKRDRYRCQIKGPRCTKVATCVDHIITKAAGGSDHESNLRAACVPCNLGRRKSVAQDAPAPSHKRVSRW